jgi:tetratricopeptide (TPR) repeat protein
MARYPLRRYVIPGSILILSLGLQIALRQNVERAVEASSQTPELLYISSGELLRRLSLGFDGLLADIYWTRAIQYYGRARLSEHPDYSLLGPLLRITTSLDPQLLIAYRFGAVFLASKPPGGAGEPEQAMQLLRRGIVANPGYWRLWEDLGFIQYWDLRDYSAAARTFQAGSKRPGAEIWMKTLAASVAARGGEIRTSQLLWSQIYHTASNTTIRKSALEHLAALKAYQDIESIDRLLDVYRKDEGHAAHSLQELVDAGLLHTIPADPSGVPYRVGPDGKATLSPGSAVDMGLLQ